MRYSLCGRQQGYVPISQGFTEISPRNVSGKRRRGLLQLIFTLAFACILVPVTLLIIDCFPTTHDCLDPPPRKEWRSLNLLEQQAYIEALQCFSGLPSKLTAESSRYDDFALAHASHGLHHHYAAAFLPWHRHFVNTFEAALRTECLYNGSLIYWDWSLDAADLAHAPIWSPSAFGSDGLSVDDEAVAAIGQGRCVMDGPFANVTRYWQATFQNGELEIFHKHHCLSRGFQTIPKKEELQERVSLETVRRILDQQSYSSFFEELENHVHNAIPQFIRGDFLLQTAPNDPVFYLHHTQIDRLWWLWQQGDGASRMWQYQGPTSNVRLAVANYSISASLDDRLSLGRFGESVTVSEVMSTTRGKLCYKY